LVSEANLEKLMSAQAPWRRRTISKAQDGLLNRTRDDGRHPAELNDGRARYNAMTTNPVHIARTTYDAYVRKDRAAIEKLIAPDFHFTSPLDNRLDRATYLARCWPNSETIEAFAFVHLVPDGDRVFVVYEGTSIKGQRFRNTELLTIRDGQITEAEVYFGWSIPHRARDGGFVDDGAPTKHPSATRSA